MNVNKDGRIQNCRPRQIVGSKKIGSNERSQMNSGFFPKLVDKWREKTIRKWKTASRSILKYKKNGGNWFQNPGGDYRARKS